MKKVLIMILAGFMCLTGCGSKPAAGNQNKVDQNQSNDQLDTENDKVKQEETNTAANNKEEADNKDELENKVVADNKEENNSIGKEDKEVDEKGDTVVSTEKTEDSRKKEENNESKSSDPITEKKENNKTESAAETAAKKAIKKIQEQAAKKKANFSVAYVGYYSGDFKAIQKELKKAGITDKMPFISVMKEDNFLSQEGDEVYVIIPNENIRLDIHRCYYDFDGNFKVEKRMASFKSPFMIKGNISDIMPNYYIKAYKAKKNIVQYSPSLSLMDGKLAQKKGVYDFSPYEELPFFSE